MLFTPLFFLTPKLLQKRRQIQTNPPLTVRNTTKTMHWEWPWVFLFTPTAAAATDWVLQWTEHFVYLISWQHKHWDFRTVPHWSSELATHNTLTVSNLIYCRTLLLTLLKEVPGYLLWLLTPFIINPSALMKGIIVSTFTSVSPLSENGQKNWTCMKYF